MIFSWRTIPNAFMAALRVFELWILGRPVVVSNEIADARQARCQVCPQYAAASDQCRACTCVVSLKVLLASERCPHRIPKWTEATRFSSGLMKLPGDLRLDRPEWPSRVARGRLAPFFGGFRWEVWTGMANRAPHFRWFPPVMDQDGFVTDGALVLAAFRLRLFIHVP